MRLVILIFMLFTACKTPTISGNAVNPYSYNIQKSTKGTKGAVVTAHPLASQIGISVLKQGGNAFDAAIATQLALAVVYPGAGNIGGGGFMVAYTAKGKALALDFRETAPALATANMYLDEKGNIIPGKSLNGHLSAGIPGTVAGLFETHKYAKLPFKKLIQPAIELAEKGFVITKNEANSLNEHQQDFKKYNTSITAFQKPTSWKAGDTLIQKNLAQTLKRIRDRGLKGFYEGRTAHLIVEEMLRGGGIITSNDLKNYKAIWRAPHSFTYKNHHIIGMPMPSSGGVLLHQMMKMVETKNISQYGFLEPTSVQLMIEAERRAYADRSEYMGDADFIEVPVKQLIDSFYLIKRMSDFIPGVAGNSKNVQPGLSKKISEETTHISILDAEGNAVSITTTLNNSYGSKTVVGGAGFLLNDEMDDFSAKPGTPNLYGAVGGKANAIAPGKRMLSSMTPTIVLKNNKPFIVVGTPGGTTIPTSVFQTLINIIDFNVGSVDAVNKPKFHHQWLPDEVFVEEDFPVITLDALKKMGYKISTRQSIGRVELIQVLNNGTIRAVADKRGDDDAAAW